MILSSMVINLYLTNYRSTVNTFGRHVDPKSLTNVLMIKKMARGHCDDVYNDKRVSKHILDHHIGPWEAKVKKEATPGTTRW